MVVQFQARSLHDLLLETDKFAYNFEVIIEIVPVHWASIFDRMPTFISA